MSPSGVAPGETLIIDPFGAFWALEEEEQSCERTAAGELPRKSANCIVQFIRELNHLHSCQFKESIIIQLKKKTKGTVGGD